MANVARCVLFLILLLVLPLTGCGGNSASGGENPDSDAGAAGSDAPASNIGGSPSTSGGGAGEAPVGSGGGSAGAPVAAGSAGLPADGGAAGVPAAAGSAGLPAGGGAAGVLETGGSAGDTAAGGGGLEAGAGGIAGHGLAGSGTAGTAGAAGALPTATGGEGGAVQPSGSVMGFVTRQGEVDHSGATVTLDGTDQDTVTDASGAFQFDAVAPGTYTVTASLAGYGTQSSSPFQVMAGQPTVVPPITLQLGTGSLSGLALLDGQDVHAGIVILIEGTSYATVTAANGAWSISGVEAGNYAVRARYDGYDDALVSDQDVQIGQVTTVPNLTLVETRSSISGTVTLEGTSDYGGVSVIATATWNPTITGETSTNSTGFYQIEGLRPGTYRVEASKSSFLTGTQDNVLVLATEPTIGIDFSLEAAPVGIAQDIQYVSGGSNDSDAPQAGVVNNPLADPFVVRIVDGLGNPVANAHVTYTIVAPQTDGHMLTTGMVTTGSDGLASNTYVLGKIAGTNHVRIECLEIQNDEVDFYADGLPDAPDHFVATGGSLQSGVAGQELAELLQVELRDQWNNVVPDQTVSFTPSDDGAVTATSMQSDSSGGAATRWTLGTDTSVAQTLTVVAGSAEHIFTANIDHDVAHHLTIASGNLQSGVNTTTLVNPLVVEAQDQYGNPVDGVAVSFAVTAGTGSLSNDTQDSAADGRASTSLTLESVGALQVTASAAGLASVVFDATSTVAAPHHLVIVGGDDQSGTVATQLSQPLTVRVEDTFNNPIEGLYLHFEVGATSGILGSVGAVDIQTDATGTASTTFTLGTFAGDNDQWVTVTVNGEPGVPAVILYANPVPDAPTLLEMVSGNDQSAAYGAMLPQPLVVHAEDQFGNPAWNSQVTWTSTTGGLIVPNPTTPGADGKASVDATLGTTGGQTDQDFTAEVNGLTVAFNATATVHEIYYLDPLSVYPGYPDPTASDPSSIPVTITIIGAGFDPAAVVVWDAGGTDEIITPDSATGTEITFQVTADRFVAEATYPLVVRNPGPSDSAPEPLHVRDHFTMPTSLCQYALYGTESVSVARATVSGGDIGGGAAGITLGLPPESGFPSASISGDVYGLGSVTLNNVDLDGSVTAAGAITISGGSMTGSSSEFATVAAKVLPEWSVPCSGGDSLIIDDDTTLPPGTYAEISHGEARITLQPGTYNITTGWWTSTGAVIVMPPSGRVLINMCGMIGLWNFTIEGLTATDASRLMFYTPASDPSAATFAVNSDADPFYGVVLAPNGTVRLRGSNILGAFYAHSVEFAAWSIESIQATNTTAQLCGL